MLSRLALYGRSYVCRYWTRPCRHCAKIAEKSKANDSTVLSVGTSLLRERVWANGPLCRSKKKGSQKYKQRSFVSSSASTIAHHMNNKNYRLASNRTFFINKANRRYCHNRTIPRTLSTSQNCTIQYPLTPTQCTRNIWTTSQKHCKSPRRILQCKEKKKPREISVTSCTRNFDFVIRHIISIDSCSILR